MTGGAFDNPKLRVLIGDGTKFIRETAERFDLIALATRAVAHSEKASILELDLVTQGRPPLAFNRADLPAHHYLAIVSRANNATTHECFPANLRRRLPKIRLPLAADDRDTVIDLQVVFARAFEQSQLEKCIDYREPLPPDVVLSADDREWVEALAETHAVG